MRLVSINRDIMDHQKDLANEFISGGWVILVIGACGMAARIIYSGAKHTLGESFRKIFGAVLCSGIAWFILEQTDIQSIYKAMAYGIVGVVSPEIIQGLINVATKIAKDPLKFFKK